MTERLQISFESTFYKMIAGGITFVSAIFCLIANGGVSFVAYKVNQSKIIEVRIE